MPLNFDNVIQQKIGDFNAATGDATLDAATADGSMVVIAATILGDVGGLSEEWELQVPAGFESVAGQRPGFENSNNTYLFIKRDASAESSWTLTVEKNSTTGFARDVVWAAFEVIGVGLDQLGAVTSDPFGYTKTTNMTGSDTNVATRSTGTTEPTACYDTLSFAVHGATSPTTTPSEISGHTNGFTEIAQSTRVTAANALTLSVAVLPSQMIGSKETTASLSPSAACYAGMVMLHADGARFMADVAVMTGLEFGTGTNIAVGSDVDTGTGPFDAATGTPEVVTDHPRSGTYCAKLSAAAAAENVAWLHGPGALSLTFPTFDFPITLSMHVYFESLPGADVELASIEAGSLANGLTIWYRSASQKITVKSGTGTEVVSDATVATGHWIGVEARYDARFATHVCDWRIDYNSNVGDATGYVNQTQATGGGTSQAQITAVRLGWAASRTATVFYDDVVVMKEWGCFPAGDMRISLLKVDPSGTPAIVGTAGNFRTFTNNGTLAAWTAAATKTALDEVPPVVGGSADGLTQITAATGDYCEIPMETLAATPDLIPRAVRWYVAGWAASSTAANLGVKFADTAGIDCLISTSDHGWDNASLRWVCKMHRDNAVTGPYLITQAKLDALRVQVGFSGDATPDTGILAAYAEVAVQKAAVVEGINQEEGKFVVELRLDDVSSAIRSLLGTVQPGTRGATMTWTISGTPGSQYITPHATLPQTYEKVIGAVGIDEVTAYGLVPDPT